MYPSRLVVTGSPLWYLVAAVAATAALLWAVGAAAAQTPRIPPDARGFQATQMLQRHQQQKAAASRSAPTAPVITRRPVEPAPFASGVDVTVAAPAPAPAPVTVAIRGPDGEVKKYVVEGGRESIVVRRYVVGPGEQVTILVPQQRRPAR